MYARVKRPRRPYSRAVTVPVLSFVAAAWAVTATAATDQLAQIDTGLTPTRLSVGGGPVVFPEYPGASTYRVMPVPFVNAQWGNRTHVGLIRGARVNILSSERLFAGPVLRYLGGREARGAISALDDVSGGFATGAVVRYEAGPVRFRGEVLTPVSGDIAGSEVSVSAVWRGSLGSRRWIYSIGPSATWVSDNRADALYGLDVDDAAALGVDPHGADAGVSTVRLTATLTHVFSEHWTATGFASMGYLQGDVADSPVVDDLGRRQQGFAGVIINRHF